ncbi:MAG: phosphotriesterase [Luteitalea sp.]|nr:phosphotriesterase [Luteitalea sp.]
MRRIHWLALVVGCAALLWSTVPAGSQAPAASGPIPDMTGKVLTVNGPINPDQLGTTITHEHVFIDFTVPDETPERWAATGRTKPVGATAVGVYNAPLGLDILGAVSLGAVNRDNWLLLDETVAIREVMEFKERGGGTIVDTTSIGLKRDPLALRRVASATGLNIVMGASWYRKGWFDDSEIERRSVESLADEIVRDVTVGVGETGIRSGIIGEVGTVGNPLVPLEAKIISESGRASRLTGAAVTLHTSAALKEQPKILDLLAQEGADLRRVIVGHSNALATDIAFMKQLLDRGVYIQFDLLGRSPTVRTRITDTDVAKGIVELIKAGYNDRILLSQDVCTKVQLKSFGGSGYSFVVEQFIPYLKRLGVTDAQVNTIMVENPRRALTFVAPVPGEVAS